MKKIINIFILAIIVFGIINIFNMNESLAILPGFFKPEIGSISESEGVISIANKIIGAFQAIGSIVSVLALVFIGIKYMMGSIEEKAEYKQTMINYVIGAILVFAISNISALLFNFALELY